MQECSWRKHKIHLTHRIGLRRTITANVIVLDGFGGAHAYLSNNRRIHIPADRIAGIEEVKTPSPVASKATYIASVAAGVLAFWGCMAWIIKSHM